MPRNVFGPRRFGRLDGVTARRRMTVYCGVAMAVASVALLPPASYETFADIPCELGGSALVCHSGIESRKAPGAEMRAVAEHHGKATASTDLAVPATG